MGHQGGTRFNVMQQTFKKLLHHYNPRWFVTLCSGTALLAFVISHMSNEICSSKTTVCSSSCLYCCLWVPRNIVEQNFKSRSCFYFLLLFSTQYLSVLQVSHDHPDFVELTNKNRPNGVSLKHLKIDPMQFHSSTICRSYI